MKKWKTFYNINSWSKYGCLFKVKWPCQTSRAM